MKKSLAQRILEVIESSDLPVSTPDLIAVAAPGIPSARSQVWVQLRRLSAAGLVRKCGARRNSNRNTRWTEVLWGKP